VLKSTGFEREIAVLRKNLQVRRSGGSTIRSQDTPKNDRASEHRLQRARKG